MKDRYKSKPSYQNVDEESESSTVTNTTCCSTKTAWEYLNAARWLSVPVGVIGYEALQAEPEHHTANVNDAGIVSGVTIAANLISIIDNLILLHRHGEDLERSDKNLMYFGIFCSLLLIGYTAFRFCNPAHTGEIALANFLVLAANSFFRREAVHQDVGEKNSNQHNGLGSSIDYLPL